MPVFREYLQIDREELWSSVNDVIVRHKVMFCETAFDLLEIEFGNE